MFEVGQKVKTRCGKDATILATDINHPTYTLAVRFTPNGSDGEIVEAFTASGARTPFNRHADDLVPPKVVRYVNVYYGDAINESRAHADMAAGRSGGSRIACVRIEFTPGQMDE